MTSSLNVVDRLLIGATKGAFFNHIDETRYRGSPTYVVFTTADPTTAIFGLCIRKWGIFALSRGPLTVPLTRILRNVVFSSPKIRVRWGPSVGQSKNILDILDKVRSLPVGIDANP